MGQVIDPGEIIESKTLIDASDKPLRRRSPPGMALQEEDWPVLFPKRPTSPETLQEMLHRTGSQLTQQATSGQKERYPVLGNTLRQVPDEEQLPVPRYSATYKMPRKETSSLAFDKDQGITKDTTAEKIHLDDPFKDGVYDSGPILPNNSPHPTRESSSVLSAGAAAVEKLAQESKSTVEPRQTRTSSLRARLSAGQLVRDSQNRVVGFTDFTATPEPALGTTRRSSFRARKEAQAHRSLTPPAKPISHPLRTNPSRESIGGNRAPAQFVAGSRRPIHPRRPSSRGSLRNEFRESTPPLRIASSSQPAPTRPAPAIPRREAIEHGKPSHKALIKVPESKRSTPVSRQSVSNMPREPIDKTDVANCNEFEVNIAKEDARDDPATLTEDASSDVLNPSDPEFSNVSSDPVRDTNYYYSKDQSTPALVENTGAHVLEAIEESPQHAYKFKRLSTASPEFGPTLKISASAERLIMGPDTKNVKNLLGKKNGKELERTAIKKHQKDRPSSSQGLSRQESRVGLIDTKTREKKVKSIDLGNLSPAVDHLMNGSHGLTPQLNHESTDASARGSSVRTSVNDPFFDARSQLQASPGKGNDVDSQELNEIGEESWISPSEVIHGDSSQIIMDNTATLPSGSKIENGSQTDYRFLDKRISPFEDSTAVAESFAKESKTGLIPDDSHIEDDAQTNQKLSDEVSSFEGNADAAKNFVKERQVKDDDTSVIFVPSTPEQRPNKDTSSSSSHPPRSSSRMAHPDFIAAKSSPVSPLSRDDRPPTPLKDTPQDFAHRQNNLGSLRGHGTSPLDLSSNMSKRDSTARESSKSQASTSKGSLSIFRGLFHKRSSENEPFKSAKKTKSRATINGAINGSTGSPFPPISEVHPIHRPTLASLARSAASTPRPTTASRPNTPATPSLVSPLATETSTSTNLALELLDLSRKERSSPRKENLLQLGSIMVEGITQTRNAEKAMEEAKQAARRAEVAHALCKKSLKEVTRCVELWKGELH